MSKQQTIFSEIHVALSIANVSDPLQIKNVDNLAANIYHEEKAKRTSTKDRINTLSSAGDAIRKFLISNSVQPNNVKWTGAKNIGAYTSVAKDIEVSNYRVSVKENADVFINGSPERIFIYTPQGLIGQTVRGCDWFYKIAPVEYNDYYQACIHELNITEFPSEVTKFYDELNKEQRKIFGKKVKSLHDAKNCNALEKYSKLCQKVSEESAKQFNSNLSKRKQALSPIFHFFFKINGISYMLAGTEKSRSFAVLLPSSDEWIRGYEFKNIIAKPKIAGQPEVILECLFYDKKNKKEFVVDLKIEIRWSHGKFCGNPEAKVYKQWSYDSLPWVINLF